MSPVLAMDRESLIRLFFFAAFAVIVYQLFLLSEPFLPGLLFAAVLAVMLNPLKLRLRRKIKSPSGAAALLTLGAVLVTIVPLIGLSITILHESRRLLPTAQAFLGNLQ